MEDSGIINRQQQKLSNATGSENNKPNEIESLNKEDSKDTKDTKDAAVSNNQKETIQVQGEEPINSNLNQNIDSGKRHRRRKSEIGMVDRAYKCPDCDKCYLMASSLITHRKLKHGYGYGGTNEETKTRGRPRKDNQPGVNKQNTNTNINNNCDNAQNKFNLFFNNETRKPPTLDQTLNEKTISLDIIKSNLTDIFKQCQKELFSKLENVEQYYFYKLLVDKWDKEIPIPGEESNEDEAKIQAENPPPCTKLDSTRADFLFYIYLKEFSKKTNKEYFWFMIKFIVLFRECINLKRKGTVEKECQNEEGKETMEYTQIYDAENIPEMCNEFYIEFMEPQNFFGLNQNELIELIQHFCYWLYYNHYTQSQLTLL